MKEEIKNSLRIVANILKEEIEDLEPNKGLSLNELEAHIGNNNLERALSFIHGLSRYKMDLLNIKDNYEK
jgi:hypothetical protein